MILEFFILDFLILDIRYHDNFVKIAKLRASTVQAHCQPSARPEPAQCQPSASQVPAQCQQSTSRVPAKCQPSASTLPAQCQPSASTLPAKCQPSASQVQAQKILRRVTTHLYISIDLLSIYRFVINLYICHRCYFIYDGLVFF